jgi:nucleolar protein 56
VVEFAERVSSLAAYRVKLHTYLRDKMNSVAPNLAALIGEMVGARLISHAGSLTSLAKYPASTVQILGAEKALFRALKAKGNTPKYGLIFHSSFIGKASSKNKGRISRYLANKCSIASRLDCFADVPTDKYGLKLKEQVEERLAFYEGGAVPRKNVDMMREVLDEVKLDLADQVPPVLSSTAAEVATPETGSKKKKKKEKTPKSEKKEKKHKKEKSPKSEKKDKKKAKKEHK